jgi:NDP-sugar pyrophosphorylase family protein
MAGAGQRFVDAGYDLPKPLIEVGGLPMAVRAAQSLPAADHWIFICRSEHVRERAIDEVLGEHFPGAEVLTVDRRTEGQASTCLLAKTSLREDDALTIGACDNAVVWERDALEAVWSRTDALIWTFRNDPVVERDPTAYGWVAVDGDGRVTRVSCKVPISDTPRQDHAVVGAFSFRRADTFVRCVESMIAGDRRLNGEFYMDVALDESVRLGFEVRPWEVREYVSWGTPKDYEENREWQC